MHSVREIRNQRKEGLTWGERRRRVGRVIHGALRVRVIIIRHCAQSFLFFFFVFFFEIFAHNVFFYSRLLAVTRTALEIDMWIGQRKQLDELSLSYTLAFPISTLFVLGTNSEIILTIQSPVVSFDKKTKN